MLIPLLTSVLVIGQVSPSTRAERAIELAPLRLGFPQADTLGGSQGTLVDWDGDGDLDALQGWAGALELLDNDGHGRFTRVTRVAASVQSRPALGDLNGDGWVDAWFGGVAGSTILSNDGAGGFVAVPSPLVGPLALADLDGDGALDWLAESWIGLTEDLRWSRNRGDATFEPEIALGVMLSSALAVADLDADGDQDLWHVREQSAGSSQRGLELLFNDGAGGFADRLLLGLPPIRYGGPNASADVDGNGLVDLLFADPAAFSPRRVRVFLNRGARQFEDASAGVPLATSITALEVADLDGNGAPDLAIGHELLLNDGLGGFRLVPATPTAFYYSSAIESGDVDGDGDVDLLLADQGQLLLGDGTGSLFLAGAEPRWAGSGALGDLDGDGWLDSLGCAEDGSACGTLRNDGRGVLELAAGTVPPELNPSYGARLGDLDGDGDLDFLVDGVPLLGRNDGTGSFTASPCGETPWGLDGAFGDLDGDGDLDAYFARARRISCHFAPCYRSEPDTVLRNDGTGVLLDGSASLATVYGVGLAVGLGDLERDGDLDVITNFRFLRNDGAGNLGDEAIFWTTQRQDVALGDADQDGDVDVFLAGDPDQWAKNDGSGTFRGVLDLPGAGEYLELADLDGDLDLDLIETRIGAYYGAFQVLRNDGNGFVTLPQEGLLFGRFTLGDLDRDGDADLLDGRRALFNLHRSLAHRGVPRIAHPLTLDVRGEPLRAFLLLASRGLAPQESPSLGLRQIDPRAVVLVHPGLLDGKGRAEWSLAVPARAALIGATWHWQALLPEPRRWSSRETTTLVGF